MCICKCMQIYAARMLTSWRHVCACPHLQDERTFISATSVQKDSSSPICSSRTAAMKPMPCTYPTCGFDAYVCTDGKRETTDRCMKERRHNCGQACQLHITFHHRSCVGVNEGPYFGAPAKRFPRCPLYSLHSLNSVFSESLTIKSPDQEVTQAIMHSIVLDDHPKSVQAPGPPRALPHGRNVHAHSSSTHMCTAPRMQCSSHCSMYTAAPAPALPHTRSTRSVHAHALPQACSMCVRSAAPEPI